jgi:hypothetical protein
VRGGQLPKHRSQSMEVLFANHAPSADLTGQASPGSRRG